jgi:hypothetical protein
MQQLGISSRLRICSFIVDHDPSEQQRPKRSGLRLGEAAAEASWELLIKSLNECCVCGRVSHVIERSAWTITQREIHRYHNKCSFLHAARQYSLLLVLETVRWAL